MRKHRWGRYYRRTGSCITTEHAKTIETYHAAKKFTWANSNKAKRCTNRKNDGKNMFLFGTDLSLFGNNMFLLGNDVFLFGI